MAVHYQLYHEELWLTEVDPAKEEEYFANLTPQDPTLDSLVCLAEEFARNSCSHWDTECSQVCACGLHCGGTRKQ